MTSQGGGHERLQVDILVSDPWGFVTAHGSGPFRGSVIGERPAGKAMSLVIVLDERLEWKGEVIEYLLAVPHFKGGRFSRTEGGVTHADLAVIEKGEAESTTRVDMRVPLGDIVLIGTITNRAAAPPDRGSVM